MSKEKSVELPTDEQLIELLGKIKGHCKNCSDCYLYGCVFYNNERIYKNWRCQIIALITLLDETSPCDWNMEEIERIIKL